MSYPKMTIAVLTSQYNMKARTAIVSRTAQIVTASGVSNSPHIALKGNA